MSLHEHTNGGSQRRKKRERGKFKTIKKENRMWSSNFSIMNKHIYYNVCWAIAQ